MTRTPEPAAAISLMQPWPLTINRIIEHAARWHGKREVVGRDPAGVVSRSDYATVERRARQLSSALLAAGIRPGDRVATLAMNGVAHLESWYGISGIGAICHTLNPRLFDDQLEYIVNHAGDRVIFADAGFLPLLERLLPKARGVERIVFIGGVPAASVAGVAAIGYEELLAGATGRAAWGEFDEHMPASLCYTSGTTGHPKGVLYSHRTQVLHTLLTSTAEAFSLTSRETILLLTPMFHANAWGVPFGATAAGAKLVLPGPKLDAPSIYELLETERVTFSGAVPTVWQMLLDYMRANSLRLSTLKQVLIGGSACPAAVFHALRDEHGVEVLHAWGMTETSPLGTVSAPSAEVLQLPPAERDALTLKQGRVIFGIDIRITDDEGRMLPHDGVTQGHLKVRGPCVIARYFGADAGGGTALDADGYFDTGDISTIDSYGFMQITDRSKDLIKSGGEWISSVEIENVAAGHPKALMAAVIAVPHPKWRERPLLIVKLRPGEQATAAEFLAFLEGKIARWSMPDGVEFVAEMPLGATGKLDKKRLRAQFGGAAFG